MLCAMSELEDLRRLVAMYQSEGEHEIPEEEEYTRIVNVPKKQRTRQHVERLKVLAVLTVEMCDSGELRKLVKQAWNCDKIQCPVCRVSLLTDFHLEACPLGLILSR